jgi:hypothetical protein
MKYKIIIATLSVGLVQGMEKKQKLLIPGLPNPENIVQERETDTLQQHTLIACLTDALEKRNSLKEEKLKIEEQKLELRKRIFYLTNARAIYKSFSSSKKTDQSKLYQQAGGRERKDGISEKDALAALRVIVSECDRMQDLGTQLNKNVTRKKIKDHSPRELNQGESDAKSKKET